MSASRLIALLRPDSPARISVLYALIGTVWIVASDGLVGWAMGEGPRDWLIDSGKGLAFLWLTAWLLHSLIQRLERRHLRVEEKLRISEQRLALALQATDQGLFDFDVPSGAVVVNEAYASMLGHDPATFTESWTGWCERLHPEDRIAAEARLNEYLAGRVEVYRAEFRLRTAEGGWLWIHSEGRIVTRDHRGSPLRMVGTHRDIQERKLAEEKSEDALAFARAVLHSTPVGVISYGPDGRALLANEAAARIIGTDIPGVLRQNFRELKSWREQGLLDVAEQALATGVAREHSGKMVTSFGRPVWLESRFVPFKYGGAQQLLLLISDVTERQRTLDELRLMETAVRAAPVGWVVTDPEGMIEWVNPGFTTLTGYAAHEAIGRNSRFLKSGRHSTEFYRGMWSAIKRGEVWTGEVFNQRKDGGQYQERMTIAPVRGGDGTIVHYVAIKQNITEQRELENQLARAQRLESIGLLAAGIAHDLNNIFSPILLALELLKLKSPTADARRLVEMIENAGQRGAGIVKQVLMFARGMAGDRTELKPKYLIKEMAQILSETLPRNIRIEVSIGDDLSLIHADVTQMHQVLLNLAINARDAMPQGGRLVIGAQNVEVDAARAARNPPLKPGPHVALTVSDTGTGIPPEVMDRLFEPFFTTKPAGKGTGLGLSTVYGIVRSHGGAIKVETQAGEGTKFSVFLPILNRAESAPPFESRPVPAIQGQGLRILVADDEASIREVTAAALERHGFSVVTAIDGFDALRKLKESEHYDAIVTDLMMPRMNGHDLAREIRRRRPHLPILTSSGVTGEPGTAWSEAEREKLGIRTQLTKPYTEAVLLRALEAELTAGVPQKNG